MSNPATNIERQEQLEEVIAAYLESVDAGRRVDTDDWLRRYPDLNPELAEFFEDQAKFDSVVKPLSTSAREADALDETDVPVATGTVDLAGNRSVSGPPLTNCRIGDYDLICEMGRGGMGVVYKARQRSLDRIVALKIVRLGLLSSEEDLHRLRNEVEASAHLDHPAIVPVYEVGRSEDYCFFSMKLIEGGSLSERLDEFANDLQKAARLVLGIAAAVDHAHQRGILHRDLKPSNILIDEQGQPHLVDLGLSRRAESNSELTRSGAILGTPAYMSPEQASGDHRAVTAATDVYGVGTILYCLLAGHAPFQGDSVMANVGPGPPTQRTTAVEAQSTRPPGPGSDLFEVSGKGARTTIPLGRCFG